MKRTKQIGENSANKIEQAIYYQNQQGKSKKLFRILSKIRDYGIEVYFDSLELEVEINSRIKNDQNAINQMEILRKLMIKSQTIGFYQMRVNQLEEKIQGLKKQKETSQTSSALTVAKYKDLKSARDFASLLG